MAADSSAPGAYREAGNSDKIWKSGQEKHVIL